jgi:hypothetical protein
MLRVMRNRIVSLRGTHGSGKSTVVFRILNMFPHEVINPTAKGKAEGYCVQLPNRSKLLIVGSYHTQCGGCDGISPYSEIWPRAERYLDNGHVLLEGALVSSSYGSSGHAMNAHAPQAYFAVLDTPLQV